MTENALRLFRTLGYESERQLPFDEKSFADFADYIKDDSKFSEKSALVGEWKYVDLLFQLTESELKTQNLLFENDKTIDQRITSYLFFAIELTEANYSRTALSQITREVNKIYEIPVMVLFKYGELLTLAVIDRQPHKRDESKDVLKKVTLIKDINFHKTHRAHLDILKDLSLPEIKNGFTINSFLDLHNVWQKKLDVELVTNSFFRDYKKVFERVETEIEKSIADKETARLFNQRLFNRLMFVYFVQKKGWLEFEGNSNYLRSLFNQAEAVGENFYRERLYWIFFHGFSFVGEVSESPVKDWLYLKIGNVPYLNGGLFEMEKDGYDERGKVALENSLFAEVLDLFEHYNFTVEESTPLEVQVAIDPEILGRVFEELVTGRHESGSYYTPRQIVSFMCRESLKHYLRNALSEPPALVGGWNSTDSNADGNPSANADGSDIDEITEFVDEGKGENLSEPEQILGALKRIRICDPACGSGAYLLGMMQELLRLRDALFTSKNLGDASLYNRKREIIENNIYGVDIDRFAVQIASLRLWLSLAIESKEPRALPNLKYKIGCGDSLLAPLENDSQPDLHRRALIEQFRARKNDYSSVSDYVKKSEIDAEIERLRIEIAQSLHHLPEPPKPYQISIAETQVQPLRDKVQRLINEGNKFKAEAEQKNLNKLLTSIEQWKQQIEIKDYTPDFFDWTVEFAEIFVQSPNFSLPRPRSVAETSPNESVERSGENSANEARRKHAEAWTLNTGGFDIVLANPPYIRMELFKPIKPILRQNFPKVHSDRADLYVYFFARAMQLLKENGIGTFISSNKWLKAGYGEPLRQELLNAKKFHLVVDFGDLPVFKAKAYPCVFLWQNSKRGETSTNLVNVQDLELCYQIGLVKYVQETANIILASEFSNKKSKSIYLNIENNTDLTLMTLSQYVKGKMYYGIKTGLNEAFIISKKTRDLLLQEDKRSKEIIKPLLEGNNIRCYETNYRDTFLIYTPHGIDIRHYPAIEKYLRPFRTQLENRATEQEWFELQQPQEAYVSSFEIPKIVYPDIGKYPRFAIDFSCSYGSNTLYAIPFADWFLLAILNSSFTHKYLDKVSTKIRGGYMRFIYQNMENLPIPNASDDERKAIANLAKETQNLHTARRTQVEQFLLDIGTSAAESSSRNVLEKPWELTETEFVKRAKSELLLPVFRRVRDETHSLTEQTSKIEREIDERVAELYGVKIIN